MVAPRRKLFLDKDTAQELAWLSATAKIPSLVTLIKMLVRFGGPALTAHLEAIEKGEADHAALKEALTIPAEFDDLDGDGVPDLASESAPIG